MEVNFELADGRVETWPAQPGDTVLDVALDNAVDGILGQCGGAATCCTCHCWVGEDWEVRLAPPEPHEAEMLPYAWGVNEFSRLACQIRLDESLDGLLVQVPERQS